MKNKKMIFVAPKSITNHKDANHQPFLYDYGFFNFFLPLKEIFGEVIFFDTSLRKASEFQELYDKEKPDYVFSVMTGDPVYAPDEPFNEIERITREEECITVNWFCDDAWRFTGFSSLIADNFRYVITTELDKVEEYEYLGKEKGEAIYSSWHANPDFYYPLEVRKREASVSFVGNRNSADRKTFLDALEGNKIPFYEAPHHGIEGLVQTYSSTMIGLNFSKASVGDVLQAKARPYEIVACGALLVAQRHRSLERDFVENKEIILYDNHEELYKKTKVLLDNPDYAMRVANAGREAFLKKHTSQKRLRDIFGLIEAKENARNESIRKKLSGISRKVDISGVPSRVESVRGYSGSL